MLVFGRVGTVYTVAVDTRVVRRVGPRGWNAAWSPDGRLAYVDARTDLSQRLIVMNADGSGRRAIARRAPSNDVAWSPDGQFIAFDHCGPGWVHCALWIIRPDGRGARQITRTGVEVEPIWSPDSRHIVYSTWGLEAASGLKTIDVQTRRVRRLTRGDDDEPAWSPDGRAIAFVREGTRRHPYAGQGYVVGADGRGLRRLSKRFPESAAPDWSPDGTRIAFVGYRRSVPACGRRGAAAVFGMFADTGRLRRLSAFAPDWTDVNWSPDGSRLAARRLGCSPTEPWLLSVLDGHGNATLPAGRRDTGGPIAWRPRASAVVEEARSAAVRRAAAKRD